MKEKIGIVVMLLGIFCLTVPAIAHHGFDTEYDRNQKFSLTGVVTEVRWQNPHMRVFVDVTDKNGVVTNYNLELDSPNNIRRMGWGKNDLLPGDKVNLRSVSGQDRRNPEARYVQDHQGGRSRRNFKRRPGSRSKMSRCFFLAVHPLTHVA